VHPNTSPEKKKKKKTKEKNPVLAGLATPAYLEEKLQDSRKQTSLFQHP
jgi:cytochrome c553